MLISTLNEIKKSIFGFNAMLGFRMGLDHGSVGCDCSCSCKLRVRGSRSTSRYDLLGFSQLHPTWSVKPSTESSWVRLGWLTPVVPAYVSRSSWTKRDLIYVRYVRSCTSSTKPLSWLSTPAAKVCKASYSLRKSDFRSTHATVPESYPANIVRRVPLLATIWLHFEFSCTEYPYSFHVKVHLYLSYTETLPI